MSEVEQKLFSLFSDFIRDLSKVFPEIKNSLYRNYEDCLVDGSKCLKDFPKVKRFLELIGDYEKYIVDKNLEFFDLEVEFLEEIQFNRLWEKNISNKTRESIWKYLQTFQLISINLKSSEALNAALEGDKIDKSTMKDLKKMQKLSEEVQNKSNSQGIGEGENELDQMLGGLMDSGIGDIAKEVAQSLDVESMFGNVDENSNPMELMTQLMNPEKMGAIFNNINSVMEQKMASGELTQEGLKSEAEGMMGQMGENPMFKNMMQGMQGVQQADEPNVDTSDTPIPSNSESEELSREEKQRRLREKIKEKRDNR
tara:strand:- start:37 stop:972 length:936 start_codon:yes stop_codon:yes gene_type:complete